MGIDIYARWRGQTKQEEDAQCTGFSVVHGHVGYLREAYHGTPYATRYLCKEAFESPDCLAKIPASVLRERLTKTLELVAEREWRLYRNSEAEARIVQKSYIDFVELCERKEKETNEPCTILASY